MTQPREQDRQAAAKRSRSAKAGAARSASSGQFLRVHADDDVTEVPVSKVRYGRIVNKSRVLGKVIAGYADAAAKAKRTGKAYVITYVVTPDGKAEAMAEKLAEGSLDAAVARAKARGATKAAEILKGPDMLTARDFGPLIGASHETVNTKRKRHEVLGLEGATRGVKYPRWQVTDTGLPLPGLPKLFEILGEQPWTVFRFLKTPHAELGGKTALDVLKTGRVDAVDTVVSVAENQAAGAFS
uniref:antitoxin Xre/MbcA/ParS toxin-binding domain-containing protein n=1 Tax=uncultured Caulobacter sp. TaxID=158749 RepID=UPI0025EB67E4|nr:antitoxin Xre/MbcA/ParS toxin-binding domain-containing protein [uncultured Caulobacter sp.]